MMDLPRRSGDPLAQPTRSRIFSLLSERKSPLGTEQIASTLGLHPNGVRRHLERLVEAGLIERRRQRGGRGRPGDRWLIAEGARPGGSRPTAYADLAGWLASAFPADPESLREVERAGREIGRGLAPQGTGDVREGFREALTALGFEPEFEPGDTGGGFSCCLGNCPYRDSVAKNHDVVCTLHRGMTTGLLESLDPDAKLVEFVPHDPEQAGCVVGVE